MKRSAVLLMLAVAGLAIPAGAPARGSGGASPDPIAAAVADKTRSEADRALDEGRKPAQILAFAAFKPGQVIADWGGGYYSAMLADVVGPKGRVYAVVNGSRWKADEWEPALKAHPALRVLAVPPLAQALAPASLDAIFANFEYHDLYWESEKYDYPHREVPRVLANWFAALKPGGSVIIIDHAGPAGDPRVVAGQLHRIDPARVRADMAQAGFVFDGESGVLARSDDPHTLPIFDASVRGKTDRFVLKFRRPL
ncbi:class I SAM-dependent methyltransferase [Novosphingobium sp.]|uniref:class I SAM-dependent methyltransferase n=1 Tax=Novosphingobium sp. TaxID=1874826 RepID=UPI0038BCF3B5